jgi:hypothetical protein
VDGDKRARNAAQSLAREAVERLAERGNGLDDYRGTAFFNTTKDEIFTSLPTFAPAAAAIAAMPDVAERFGDQEGERLTLQLLYTLFGKLAEPQFEDAAFDEIWEAFKAEAADPDWTYRGLANLRNIGSTLDPADLGDGVSIRGRSFEELATLGFSKGVLERLSDDWNGFGASSFVMIVEKMRMKSPETFVLMDETWTEAQRTLGALRLLAAGDVSIGPMWMVRPARFDVGLGGGTAQLGFAIPGLGSRYLLDEDIAGRVPPLYQSLKHLETHGYGRAPGNLDLALRSFMATYDRWRPGADSRLLDSITALEAVLGSGTEIAFKLAFRVASLVATNDDERASIFEEMKGFYSTRSALVHGAGLSARHQARLDHVDRLRDIVRQLLRAFVHLATTENVVYGKRFFKESLDSALQQDAARLALRQAMGLATT